MIALVLAKIAAETATVTLILPVWQSQAWRAETLGRANDAFLLPRSAGLFEAGRSQRPTPDPHWRAAALRFENGGRPWLPPGALTSTPPWHVPSAAMALPRLP